ncbi:MAG: hypothetical protein ACHQC8_03560 [Solirubrobacterales bacterium]
MSLLLAIASVVIADIALNAGLVYVLARRRPEERRGASSPFGARVPDAFGSHT